MTPIRVASEVAAALERGAAVVALESTLLAHGLPSPQALEVGRELEAIVRGAGAVPATIAALDGAVHIGLSAGALERIAGGDDIAKLSVRDLAPAVALRRDGATTVASTAYLAARVGIRCFATGGLGGVHRQARDSWDESADLGTLARTPVVVVCAGVKSILDVAATLERLETLGVAVVGYGTDDFPGFYLTSTGHPLDWRADTPAEVAAIAAAQRGLGTDDRALIVANPVAPSEQLDPQLHDRVLSEALARAEAAGVRGKDVTPFLLEHFHAATAGASLATNIAIVRANARLAAEIAVAMTR